MVNLAFFRKATQNCFTGTNSDYNDQAHKTLTQNNNTGCTYILIWCGSALAAFWSAVSTFLSALLHWSPSPNAQLQLGLEKTEEKKKDA